MLTLALMFVVIMMMLGITWWIEDGPAGFQEPVPLTQPHAPRITRTTTAGYKPTRRSHPRKEIQYR